MPRIISGTCKGTRLKPVKGLATRPTADRVKEALFSILQKNWPPDGFLDLYAGTGQIGLEAASRGAGRVVLVEKDRAGSQVIKENIRRCRLEGQVLLLQQDVAAALHYFSRREEKFSIIYADPPYSLLAQEVNRLARHLSRVLAADGLFIIEHDAALTAPDIAGLSYQRSCQYSATMLSFYLCIGQVRTQCGP